MKEENPSNDKLTKLTEQFLMAIPQKINAKDRSADVIDSLEKLAKKVELCEELGNAKEKIAVKKVSTDGKNPLDVTFENYKVKFNPCLDEDALNTIKKFGSIDYLGFNNIYNLRAKVHIEKVYDLIYDNPRELPKNAVWVWFPTCTWGMERFFKSGENNHIFGNNYF